jgi:hypothetical protein
VFQGIYLNYFSSFLVAFLVAFLAGSFFPSAFGNSQTSLLYISFSTKRLS